MLKLYPRGFVGPEVALTDDNDDDLKNEVQVVGNTFRVKQAKKPERPFDKDISFLFHQYRKDTARMNNFEFREKLLEKAKDMFTLNDEIMSFKQFILTQIEYGELSFNHVECLKEITNFLLKGVVGYRIVIWERILSDPENSILTPRNKREVIKIFNQINDPLFESINTTLIQWTYLKNGYSHLLRTLWLFYGESLRSKGE